MDQLHRETAQHFRAIRVTEIQKMEDRRVTTGPRRFAAAEQAADAWDAADLTDLTPLAEWVRRAAAGPTVEVHIPDERPAYLDPASMFDQATVYFGKRRQVHVECPSRGTAELLARMATLGVSGAAALPADHAPAVKLLDRLDHRHSKACDRLRELVRSRTADPDVQGQVFDVLQRWLVLGRTLANPAPQAPDGE